MTDAGTAADAIVGTWRTTGEILGDDAFTVVGTIEGTDAYEWLGRSTIVHRANVTVAGDYSETLEVIGPFDAITGTYPTRAYGSGGDVEDAEATVDAEGTWTFGSGGANAILRIAPDGRSMAAEWRHDLGSGPQLWMRLAFERLDQS